MYLLFRSRNTRDKKDKEKTKTKHKAIGATTTQMPAKTLQAPPSQTLPTVSNTVSDQENDKALVSVCDQSNYTDPASSLWNSWKLDADLLQQIKEWNLKHPDKRLITFFKNTCNGINQESVFFELLPDGTVPIRGLVRSLLYLCKLAATVTSAKDKVIVFMQEMVAFLEALAYAFDNGGGGKLESEAWRSLDEMGNLINDACHWSSSLLSLELALIHRLSVESQIQDYRIRFTRILEQFGFISGIQLAKGLDGVNCQLANVAEMISKNDNDAKRLEFLKRRLLPRVVENASYVLQEKRPCEPETRLDVLKEIRLWIEDISDQSQCFYWLSGAPGVGKSAITASVAKHCIDRNILGAQFFINRNDTATTDPRVLFPTICWRLCQTFPRTVATATEETLRDQPTLIDDISNGQATKLFVKAIEAASATDPSSAVVVVIDALDETDPKRLWDLAQIFSKVLTDLPSNAKVFISSRGEDAITKAFNSLRGRKQVKSRYLATKESIEEVSRFMEKKIQEILLQYNMNYADWGDDRMRRLSAQASGLYIWAETALKFIQAEIGNSGNATCMGGLLDMLTANGMDEINNLYLGILRKACKHGDWEYLRFRHIIGTILVQQTPLSIADIGQILDLEDPVFLKPVDLVHFVRQYRTVLVSDTTEINDLVVPKMHKSFTDFITSESAKDFRVDKSVAHKEIALRCIDRLYDLSAYLKLETSTFPAQLVYASQYWRLHLTRMVEPNMNDADDADERSENDKSDKFEGKDVKSFLKPSESLSTDLKHLKPERRNTIFRLLSYAFSPDGTQIASSYEGGVIYIWDARTGAKTISLIGHAANAKNIVFSPDGARLVSANDKTARIWDARIGKELWVLYGHTGKVRYAAFSNDGERVVTCSDDKTLRCWSTQTGRQLREFRGHKFAVIYFIISPNDQRIASLSLGDVIRVWDLNSGELISTIDQGVPDIIAFCPNGEHIISYVEFPERIVFVWDSVSGKPLKHTAITFTSNTPLDFVEDLTPRSAGRYTVASQAPQQFENGTPQLYMFHTKSGTGCGIVERGEGVWGFLDFQRGRLHFVAGATRMNRL